jgi:hypothetical protein
MSLRPVRSGARAACGIVTLLCVGLGACVYDANDRCGPDQVYYEEEDACRCAEGLVVDEDTARCVPCADDEVVEGGECVCAEGFERPPSGGLCREAQMAEGLDEPCDPDASDDCSGDFDLCVADDHGGGYCTTECATDGDCIAGHACAPGDPDFCQRPPTGEGETCSEQVDCEGYDASYCEALIISSCLVPDCAEQGGACFGEHVCCDFSTLGDFPSLCVPPEELMGDACPFGATRVGGGS